MKPPSAITLNKPALALALLLCAVPAVTAQNDAQKPALAVVGIGNYKNLYICYYKDFKPDKEYSVIRAMTIPHIPEEEPKPPCGKKRGKHHKLGNARCH